MMLCTPWKIYYGISHKKVQNEIEKESEVPKIIIAKIILILIPLVGAGGWSTKFLLDFVSQYFKSHVPESHEDTPPCSLVGIHYLPAQALKHLHHEGGVVACRLRAQSQNVVSG